MFFHWEDCLLWQQWCLRLRSQMTSTIVLETERLLNENKNAPSGSNWNQSDTNLSQLSSYEGYKASDSKGEWEAWTLDYVQNLKFFKSCIASSVQPKLFCRFKIGLKFCLGKVSFRPTFSPLKGKSWLFNQVIYLRLFKIWRLKFTVLPKKPFGTW